MTGTEALLQLSADLAESATEVRGGYHLGRGAKLMELAAEAIKRLAEHEPDLEVEQGEN